mgnify:FL=1|tara:strand:+ start:5647 stop:7068 length:1422 start_codon:yes stop_codon:yes gene_type:complete
MSELDKFIASQARLNTLAKNQSKSINLLNLQYKLLNKILGPFYTKYVELQNTMETVGDVFEVVTGKTEELGEATEVALGPISKTLKVFQQINTIMIFVLGAFALVGAAIFLLTKSFGGGEQAAGAFSMVMEAGKAVIDAFLGAVQGIIDAVSAIDFSAAAGVLIPLLEGIFVMLGNILTLYLTFIAAVFTGIGDIVARMEEAGMLQRIVDAFGVFFGLIGMALGVIKAAIDDTGITMGDLISGIGRVVQGFVDFLFASGIIDFAVSVIEYVAFIGGVIALLVGQIISLFIKVWAQLGPPIMRFVSAFFGFLEPIVRIITGIIGLIMDAVMGLISFLAPYIETFVDGIMVVLQPVIDAITFVVDGFASVLEFGGDLLGGAADFLGFNDGGIASGPKSGYPVMLHGTEAVVPLPDGRTIPVSIKGDVGGGSQTNNINISVSGGGNAKDIAKAVSDEVSKVLRNRSRGGNFTRGVI